QLAHQAFALFCARGEHDLQASALASHGRAVLQLYVHGLDVGVDVMHADARLVFHFAGQLFYCRPVYVANLDLHNCLIALRNAAICSGVLPQQAPITLAPAAISEATPVTISSGASSYTTFMFTNFGRPAFGCTMTGRFVTVRYRTTACRARSTPMPVPQF